MTRSSNYIRMPLKLDREKYKFSIKFVFIIRKSLYNIVEVLQLLRKQNTTIHVLIATTSSPVTGKKMINFD